MLRYILAALVDYPENVWVRETSDAMVASGDGIFIQVFVDKRDMGLIVGRGGTHIEAIKLLAKLVAFKVGVKVSIRLEEPK